MSLMSNLSAGKQKIFKTVKKVTMGNDVHADTFNKMNKTISDFRTRKSNLAKAAEIKTANSPKGFVDVSALDPKHRKASMEAANKEYNKYVKKKARFDPQFADDIQNGRLGADEIKKVRSESGAFRYNDDGDLTNLSYDSVHSGYKDQMGTYKTARNIAMMQSGSAKQRALKGGLAVGGAGAVGYHGTKIFSGYSGDDYYDY